MLSQLENKLRKRMVNSLVMAPSSLCSLQCYLPVLSSVSSLCLSLSVCVCLIVGVWCSAGILAHLIPICSSPQFHLPWLIVPLHRVVTLQAPLQTSVACQSSSSLCFLNRNYPALSLGPTSASAHTPHSKWEDPPCSSSSVPLNLHLPVSSPCHPGSPHPDPFPPASPTSFP